MDRISVRFSEKKDDDASYAWVDKAGMIDAYLNLFRETGITILHPSTDQYTKAWEGEQSFHERIRSQWDGIIIGVGDLDVQTAEHAIGKGSIDLVRVRQTVYRQSRSGTEIAYGSAIGRV